MLYAIHYRQQPWSETLQRENFNMNEQGNSLRIVGYHRWEEDDQFHYYCTSCQYHHELTGCIPNYFGELSLIPRVPRCSLCQAEIEGLIFSTIIRVSFNTKAKHDTSEEAALTAMLSSLPEGTKYQEEGTGLPAVRFMPHHLGKLLRYIATGTNGMLSFELGQPVISFQPPSKRSQNLSQKKQHTVVDLSIIQLVFAGSKKLKKQLRESDCYTYDEQWQCRRVTFTSTLELFTFLQDHDATLTLAMLPHGQAIVPTITIGGKRKSAISAA
jgi:hypothetical protein